MNYYKEPNEFSGTDSERIQKAVDEAKKSGMNKVVIPPYNALTGENKWVIDKAISLPSDISVVIDNAYMVMADGVYENMFINENLRREEGRKKSGRQKNISIEGIGNATLSGGEYNGLSESKSLKDGYPHISFNNMLLFSNVDGIKIKNIKIEKQRWWALCFVYCRNGYIGGIDFAADFTWDWEDGTSREQAPLGDNHIEYRTIHVKNADGIDLRRGCSNFIIENITGYTEDDSVALTALKGTTEKMYGVEDEEDGDIHNVIIRSIMTKTLCSNVRLLNQGGTKLYNILIDGVFDASYEERYRNETNTVGIGHGVMIGDDYNYGDRQNTPDETYNITVRNVVTRAKCALAVGGGFSDSLIENVRVFDRADGGKFTFSTANLENVKIDDDIKF